jgi:hypothetical protein
MNYFEKWLVDLGQRQSMPLSKAVCVEGVRDKKLGPRSDYAKIEVQCEPAERFEVMFDLPNLKEAQQHAYLDWAICGMLDVLMTENTYPLRNVRLTIKGAVIDPIRSNQMAFRHAGRDAARNVFEAIKRGK